MNQTTTSKRTKSFQTGWIEDPIRYPGRTPGALRPHRETGLVDDRLMAMDVCGPRAACFPLTSKGPVTPIWPCILPLYALQVLFDLIEMGFSFLATFFFLKKLLEETATDFLTLLDNLKFLLHALCRLVK